ncbi:UDP-glucose 6-dehydrogenase protein [Marine Group I thaumarchaeote SCGC AAA799-B03]|uniref:UDP-glucose 6-dehydrogenase n=1 Tax=Marine Group I thaumarchaeote SCGC AAA799-B03 TaxID=1502289 RepID=A0A087S919_9ARCH|nr:UDP-glucose 6-dehydrogenase protein [Marine Group I thaumarchaeote SCGC AAA799-B03]
MKIAIVGLGFVGLTTALCFASKKNIVYGVESDKQKLEHLSKNKLYFYEPDVENLLNKKIKEKTIHLTDDIDYAINKSEITFITVGTPSNKDGSANLKYLESVSKEIGRSLKSKKFNQLIVIKSTIPPGTSHIMRKIIEKESGKICGKDFGLCFNPEFLREGNAVYDTFNPDRVVVGADDQKSLNKLTDFYKIYYNRKKIPFIKTNLVNAELIKHASNSFLAMKINFINTIANICQNIPNADVNVVANAMGLDKRISPMFLQSGLGYGGSCFPKDVKALYAYSNNIGYLPSLLKEAIKVNQHQPFKAIELAERLIGKLDKKTITILGLAFKPNTDDMREAVSIPIIKKLLAKKCKIKVHDPMAINAAKKVFGDKLMYYNKSKEALKDSDCCILVTEWEEYKKLTPKYFKQHMKVPSIVDGRRVMNQMDFVNEGISFAAVGLGNIT